MPHTALLHLPFSFSFLQLNSFHCLPSSSSSKCVVIGDLDASSYVDKRKFPLSFFPDRRWSRKGYLRTRWRLSGTEIDLVNIHLIHDASNLVSVETAPSLYSVFRRRALHFTLDCLQGEGADHQPVPFFIFGDFNFRLNGSGVLKKITGFEGASNNTCREGGKWCDNDEGVREFRDESDKVVLALGKKQFSVEGDAEETFRLGWLQWTQFDQETSSVLERLSERKLSFPPTYPYEEDPESDGNKYMKTRCPAWCDRILYSHVTEQIMDDDGEDNEQSTWPAAYDILGKDVCMGDHKPVYLRMKIRSNAASSIHVPSYPRYHSSAAEDGGDSVYVDPTSEKCPRVESPSYTDLLTSASSSLPAKSTLIIYKGDKSVKVYKETTV